MGEIMLGLINNNELTLAKETFSAIYNTNGWGTGSGAGSSPGAVVDYVKVLTDFIKTHNIKTVLDYGCGDWQFSKYIDWENLVDSYIGVDVVDDLIQRHKQEYSSNKLTFQTVNTDWKMPTVDLIICKDVLQHLPNNMVEELLNSFELSSKYMILTNDANISGIAPPTDCDIGGCRPINLDSGPWNRRGTVLLQWYYQPQYQIIKDTLLIQVRKDIKDINE